MNPSIEEMAGIFLTVASPLVFGLAIHIIVYGLFIRHDLDPLPQSSESPTRFQRAGEITRDLCAKWNGRWLGGLMLLLSASMLFSGSTLLYGAKLGFGSFADTITNAWNLARSNGFRWIGLGILIFAAGVFASGMCWHTWRRSHRCRKCKYDMSQTPGVVCPECGLDRTLKYRNKKRIVLAFVLALIWPLAFAGQWGASRYSLYGSYGLVPDWVQIAGMDVLPEDMIFGSKGMFIPRGPSNVSLVGRIGRYDDSVSLDRRVWRAIRDDIADPTTDPDVLMRRTALALAIPDALGEFPDPDDPATVRAVEVLSKEVLAFAEDENPRFDQWTKSPIFAGGALSRMSRSVAAIATAEDIPKLFATLEPRTFRASVSRAFLVDMKTHRDTIRELTKQGLFESTVAQTAASAAWLAVSLVDEDDLFARQMFKLSFAEDKETRLKALLVLNSLSGDRWRDLFGSSARKEATLASLNDPDPEMITAGLMLMESPMQIDRDLVQQACRSLFTSMRDGKLPAPQAWNDSLIWALQKTSYALVYESPPDLQLLAAEASLEWLARHPSRQYAVEWTLHALGTPYGIYTPTPAVAALAALSTDPRWSDPELDPMSWVPAAIEATKKEFADVAPAQPGP